MKKNPNLMGNPSGQQDTGMHLGQWNVMAVLAVILVVFGLLFTLEMKLLHETTSDLSEIEYLSSTTQRLVRVYLRDKPDAKLLYYIDGQTEQFFNMDSALHLKTLEQPEIFLHSQEILEKWQSIYALLSHEDYDKFILETLADEHYYLMTDMNNAIGGYIYQVNQNSLNLQYTVYFLIFLMGLVATHNFLQTSAIMKKNAELATLASIDRATGLYNRSKCQELFQLASKSVEIQHSAIMVIDLNDLKKTNDVYGHRVGDDLILSFARLLKKACDVHVVKPFVGRYGGDEFIIFYKNISGEEELHVYLKELDFFVKEFNKNEDRFQISYAAGYAINDMQKNQECSIRQLFDQADESMYRHKQEMKLHQEKL